MLFNTSGQKLQNASSGEWWLNACVPWHIKYWPTKVQDHLNLARLWFSEKITPRAERRPGWARRASWRQRVGQVTGWSAWTGVRVPPGRRPHEPLRTRVDVRLGMGDRWPPSEICRAPPVITNNCYYVYTSRTYASWWGRAGTFRWVSKTDGLMLCWNENVRWSKLRFKLETSKALLPRSASSRA